MATEKDKYNVDKLQHGLYIGNNHFVNTKDFNILREVLQTL